MPDTPHQKASFFENLVQLAGKLREAQITLDAVSRPQLSQHDKLEQTELDVLLRGTRTAAEARAASLALPVLALQTGGRVFSHEKGLAGDLAHCLDDADAYYVLAFDSASAAEAHEFRAIEVKTDRPELKVRTTTVYYAEP
jgi:VWFA-related protein